MRSRSIVLALAPAAAFFCRAAGSGAADDEGAKVYADVCTACHSWTTRPLDDVHLTREQWRNTVVRMNGFGRAVPDPKLPALLDYLERTHGRPNKGASPATKSAPAGASATGGVATNDPGAAIYEDYCTTCHNAKTRPLNDKRMTRAQWKAAVDKMIGMGTPLEQDEIPPLLDYLVRTHGVQGDNSK